jgi:hypothetical protein
MWRWLLAAGVAWGCSNSAAVFAGTVLEERRELSAYRVRVDEAFSGLEKALCDEL